MTGIVDTAALVTRLLKEGKITKEEAMKLHPPCKDYIFGGCGKCPSYCHQP